MAERQIMGVSGPPPDMDPFGRAKDVTDLSVRGEVFLRSVQNPVTGSLGYTLRAPDLGPNKDLRKGVFWASLSNTPDMAHFPSSGNKGSLRQGTNIWKAEDTLITTCSQRAEYAPNR